MSISLISRPNTVNGVSKSVWVASRNPLIYRFQQYDAIFTSVNNNAGFAEFQINGVDFTAFFQVGNIVYVVYTGGPSVRATITASTFSAGNTLVTTTDPYVSTYAGTVLNLSKRTDRKLVVEVFDSAGLTLTDSVTFDGYPDQTGAIVVDVSEIVRAYVSAEWNLPGAINAIDSNALQRFYIKYQEYYDGALQGVLTSDVANIFNAVHAAMQIYFAERTYSHGGNLLGYVPEDTGRNWMTRFRVNSVLNKIRMWRGYPFTLSFLWPDTMTGLRLAWSEVDYAGVAGATTYATMSDATQNRVHRLRVDNLLTSANTRKLLLQLFKNLTNAAGGASGVTGTVTIDINLGSMLAAGAYYFVGLLQIPNCTAPVGNGIGVSMFVRNSGTTATELVSGAGGTDMAPLSHIVGTSFTTSISFDQIRLQFSRGGPSTFVYSYNGVGVLLPINTQITVDVMEPPDNPLYLFWKNSTGGDSWYMFANNYEHNGRIDGDKKSKRLLAIAENIELVEWNAINELNSPDDVFKNAITELSSAVIKTHTQINQQVYIVDADGNKTGVIIIPKQARTESRRSRHDIQIEIELPEHL